MRTVSLPSVLVAKGFRLAFLMSVGSTTLILFGIRGNSQFHDQYLISDMLKQGFILGVFLSAEGLYFLSF